jgi:mutator protein MutT
MRKVVRGIIKVGDNLWVIKRVKPEGAYWVFPGGGVEADESDEDALVRECQEELGIDVQVGSFFGKNTYTPSGGREHVVYFYECEYIGGELGTGNGPEYEESNGYSGTHEADSIKISDLKKYDLRPAKIRDGVYEMFMNCL